MANLIKKALLTTAIVGGLIFGTNQLKGAENFAPLEKMVINTMSNPDTVFSETVNSTILLDNIGYPDVTIKYTLVDTLTGNQQLVNESMSDINGETTIDKLPVLKDYVGVEEIENPKAFDKLVVTNNGTGSNHLIRFTSEAETVSKEGYIINLTGKTVATIPIKFNAKTETYDLVWDGSSSKSETYIFHTKTTNGIVSSKISNVKNGNNSLDLSNTILGKNNSYEDNLKSTEAVQDGLAASRYKVNITHENLEDFVTSVLIKENTYHNFTFNVEEANPVQTYDHQDIIGQIFHAYAQMREEGVTIRVINRETGNLIEEQITDEFGIYEFLDIPAGTQVEFELGKPGELWMVNNEYDIPEAPTDTIVSFYRLFYPKQVQVPEVGANSTITGDGAEIAEMVGDDIINFEEVLRGVNLMHNANPSSMYEQTKEFITDNFYEGTDPFVDASTARNITTMIQENYDPYMNFFEGELGFNVEEDGSNFVNTIVVSTSYGAEANIGGEMNVGPEGTNPLSPTVKIMQGERVNLGDTEREGMMNEEPSMPNEKDRAYFKLISINQYHRFNGWRESFSMENLTSEEPTSRATEGMGFKEKPLPNANYYDKPGNKPYHQGMMNQEKMNAQKQENRKNQIEYLIHKKM